ncbi:MAG TPA: nucleoside hydrolase, partial [Candidatus Limnocylindrales bacterium]|nr:nucleoside hydrolase [Candidatus Limnocylindrales bacterium]
MTHHRRISFGASRLAALVAALVGLAACWSAALPAPGSSIAPTSAAPTTAAASTGPTRPVVIDTDMAADDWLAILLLLGRPDVDVRAITVTGTGEAHCAPGVRNARALVELAGKPPIPVACGRET